MYKLDDILTLHVELTNNCQAACPMCDRTHRELTTRNITLDQFEEWFPKSFIRQLKLLIVCGNYGDAITSDHLLDIVKGVRKVNPEIKIELHTNASGRNAEWWKELAKFNVEVVFAIDGLSDTHAIYRVNTDFNKIIKNASTFIQAGGYARWHMLVFEHNEHQIESAKLYSKQLGFKEFKVKYTSRFKNGEFENLKPASGPIMQRTKCMAQNDKSVYVDVDGNLFPCCYTAYKDVMNELDYPNLKNVSIEESFETEYFNDIALGWYTSPLTKCKEICGYG